MAVSQEQSPSSLLDALYCEEEKWEDEDEDEQEYEQQQDRERSSHLLPILMLEQDMFWEDEELKSLFCKEKQGNGICFELSLSSSRREAVEWILKVNSHFGFSTLTSVLAVNYLDRFFSSFNFQKDNNLPWMVQLAAVTCLSLAAKVEETHVPLLLDLQVDGTKYVFEAKAIQKMELLVLTTLEWKMHPVTPISFLDHVIRRLGLKNHLHWEFLRRCERLLVSVLPDWRFVRYVPSVLATATMMHVIDQIESCNPLEYQNQLLGVLNISKEEVHDCYQLIVEISSRNSCNNSDSNLKRKFEEMINGNIMNNDSIPSSPNGVIEGQSCLSCDSSNDSWAATTGNNSNIISVTGSSSVSSSVSSSPVLGRKRGRVNEQPMPLQLPSLSRVFVDVVGSPR